MPRSRITRSACLCAVFAVGVLASARLHAGPPSPSPPDARAHSGPSPAPQGRNDARLFISGHSLTADPLGEDIVFIAKSLGLSGAFNQQIVGGSPIRVRVRGMDTTVKDTPGYKLGQNRGGAQGLDVLAELKAPRTVAGPYDTLLITERHDIVNVLIWEDTVRYLRHVHDRVAEREPRATTYFYHSWLGVSNLDDPRAWLAYEKDAVTAWECTVERMNASLASEKKREAFRALPSGVAITTLVERALAGKVPALKGDSTRATLKRIFTDDVHPTRDTWYFLALVSFSTIYGRSPVGAGVPAGVSRPLAPALQELAWEIVQAQQAKKPRGLKACRAFMRDSFCGTFSRYRELPNALAPCEGSFQEGAKDGPFHHDPQREAGWWFAAP